MTAVRTVERGYAASTGRRAGQVRRVHILREVGPRGWDNREGHNQTMCGQGAWNVSDSPALIRDTPHPLPEGLTWCPKCVGHTAELLGRLDEIARLLGLESGSTR